MPSIGTPSKQRSLTAFWELFTKDSNPHHSACARCRHCGLLVNHYKKSEAAQSHLNRCLGFKKFMYAVPLADRPEWPKDLPSKQQFQVNIFLFEVVTLSRYQFCG
jgi:hypothetical protein